MNWLKSLFTPNRHFNIFYTLLLVAMASLPLTNWLMLPIAILLLLNWIVEWNWNEKRQNLKQQKAMPALICFSAIYLNNFLGYLLSSNKAMALTGFDCGLWFLIAPMVMLTYAPSLFTRKRIRTAFWAFSFSTLLHIFIILAIALKKYVITGQSIYFYYTFLSVLKHPSYVALYIVTSSLFVLDQLIRHNKTLRPLQKVLIVCMLVIFTISIILLQSKAGILSFCFVAALWFITRFFTKKSRIIPGIAIIAGVILAVGALYSSGMIKKNRISETLEQIENHKENPYGHNSSEVRLTLWHSSWEVIQKNMPWGVGTGDAADALRLNSLTHNYRNVIGGHYNAHCQYLQALMDTGIVGLVLLLTYLFFPLVEGIRSKNSLFYSFAIVVILNISVECMFNVRSGVDFIAITNILCFLISRRNHE